MRAKGTLILLTFFFYTLSSSFLISFVRADSGNDPQAQVPHNYHEQVMLLTLGIGLLAISMCIKLFVSRKPVDSGGR